MIIAELIGIIIYAAAPVLIAAFNRDPSVIHYGVMQARIIALFLLSAGIFRIVSQQYYVDPVMRQSP